MSTIYKSVRKNFIFHNKKALAYLEQQPNKSKYIEDLILKDLTMNTENLTMNLIIEKLDQLINKNDYNKQLEIENIPIQKNISSISNILNVD